MVMIPSDVGVRLRTQTEPPLNPILPTGEVAPDISDLPPGKIFSAQIQEVLPENTYKALVAGRQLTLALPQGAKAGDILELVVIDRSARVIVAQLANPTADGASGKPYEFTNLSKAGQLIGSLLARDGQAPPSVALNRGQALIAQPSLDARQFAADLAPQLAKAVSESGLFYEAHQVQWVTGQRPATSLLAEPQGKYSTTPVVVDPTQTDAEAADTLAPQSKAADIGSTQRAATGPLSLLQALFGIDSTQAANSTAPPATAPAANTVPEDLRPIVQQQLDAAATQRLAWHGDVWPQQPMQWQIERDDGSPKQNDGDSARGWSSSLKLTTPRLGEIDARLKLSMAGVRISIETATATSAGDLRYAVPALEISLAAAGVPLLSLAIKALEPGMNASEEPNTQNEEEPKS